MERILEEPDEIHNYVQSDEVTSVVSHASTALSVLSRMSAPISSSRRYVKNKNISSDRDAMSDIGVPFVREKLQKIHINKQKNGKGKLFNVNIYLSRYFPKSKTQVLCKASSVAPSSNDSVTSNAGPPLPFPQESSLNMKEGKGKEDGFIMARTSRVGLIFRRWDEECYWSRYNRTSILVFSSRENYISWKKLSDIGDEKAKLYVKSEINFNVKKSRSGLTPEVKKYWIGDIKPKRYPSHSGYIHQFKIEKSTHSGTNVVAVFASTRPSDLNLIRTAIKKCMKRGGMTDKVKRLVLPCDLRNDNHSYGVCKDRLETTMHDFEVDDGSSLASSQMKARSVRRSFSSNRIKSRFKHNDTMVTT